MHVSTTSAQSTPSLSSKSLLRVRLGSSRSCSKSSSSLVRPSVHDLRRSISIQRHYGDQRRNHVKNIILEEESQEDLSQQARVPQCIKVPSTPSAVERELHELTHFPLSESTRTSWSTQASFSEEIKCDSVGSFILQGSWRRLESQGSYLH